jgi:hypothetical protein
MLATYLPVQVATRNFAYYNKANGLSCSDYVSPAVSTANTAILCQSWDFTSVNSLLVWVNDAWYGTTYIVEHTLLNSTEFDIIYDPATEGSFGWTLAQINQNVSLHYGCTNVSNCTGSDIA